MTFSSLLIAIEGYSGTGWRIQRGEPHFYYTSWTSIEDGSRLSGFSIGSFGIYLFSDLAFYLSALLLIASACIAPRRHSVER